VPDPVTGGDPKRRAEVSSEASGEPRDWLIAAFAKAAAEHGYANLEIEHVLRHAGVSRAAFDTNFTTMEQGLIAAQDAFFDRLWLDIAAACEEPADWAFKVRAGLAAVLSSLVEASSLARVFAIEAAGASLAAAERQFATLDRLAELLRDGRGHYPLAKSLPEATERALVGGVASIVSGHLLREDVEALRSLEVELAELLLTPYLGEEEARRIAATRGTRC
jgi:AcrR family transcriptional regulator